MVTDHAMIATTTIEGIAMGMDATTVASAGIIGTRTEVVYLMEDIPDVIATMLAGVSLTEAGAVQP